MKTAPTGVIWVSYRDISIIGGIKERACSDKNSSDLFLSRYSVYLTLIQIDVAIPIQKP